MIAELENLETDVLDAALSLTSPAEFAVAVSRGRWRHARHLDLLNEKLLALASGKIRRLIVTMPPRHGKSELCSKFFPAWYLGRFPDRRIILCSYEAGFAANWGGKARDLLEEFGPSIFRVGVREDGRAREDWKIAGHEGGMVTAGVGGAITGRGANCLIIDDPVKNSEQASSRTYRDKAWDWWQSTAYTRLEPAGSALVIQTRWHEDDLAGRLLKEAIDPDDDTGEEKWELLNLPAIADDGDALGRVKGEALWPERWPQDKLAKRKKRLGTYFWNALFQQRPLPPGGEVFNRDKFREYEIGEVVEGVDDGRTYKLNRLDGKPWSVRVKDVRKFAVVDVAASEKNSADYSVIQVWGMTPSYDLLLLDQWREQKAIPVVASNIIRMSRAWDVEFVGVEQDGVGLPLVQTLRQRGEVVRGLKANGDKVMRATAAQLRFDAEMIYFPKGASFVDVLREELETFPKSAHDDTVDALCWGSIVAHRLGGAVRDPVEDDAAAQKRQEQVQENDHVNTTPGSRIKNGEPGAAEVGDEEWLTGF